MNPAISFTNLAALPDGELVETAIAGREASFE
jgi:hypothetical protein